MGRHHAVANIIIQQASQEMIRCVPRYRAVRPLIRTDQGLDQEFNSLEDMQAQAEKLRVDAEDCALISKLATDPNKRDLFARLAAHLSTLASEVEKAIATTLREQANDPLHQGDDEAG